MAKDSDHLADRFETENTGGLLTGFLAEEDDFDRRSLWRLGSWGVGAVGAVIVALMANQSSIGWRREQIAAADLARQSQQIQSVARESQGETRRLASAIETLNVDRERLYSRVGALEQGLDSVTGSIARQNAAVAPPQVGSVSSSTGSSSTTAPAAATSPVKAEPPPAAQTPAAAPVVAPVASAALAKVAATPDKPPPMAAIAEPGPASAATAGQTASNGPAATPATPLIDAKSLMAPPDAAAGKLAPPEAAAAPAPELVAPAAIDANADAVPATSTVQRTEFAVDLGAANTVGGLRALWRGLLKSRSNSALAALRPIIVVKEGSAGLGMQLRLAAGPLGDAAAAAKICAGMIEHEKTCETTVFDGQQLTMKDDDPSASARPASVKPVPHRRSVAKRATNEEPPKPEPTTSLSSFFGMR
jgi:hypothetical protein